MKMHLKNVVCQMAAILSRGDELMTLIVENPPDQQICRTEGWQYGDNTYGI